jgi:PPOX class probable F420-dependent enzyme
MSEPSSLALLQGQSYISLATFRRNGQEVPTPVWFAEYAGRLYVMTRNDSGKYKRIRNNPQVRLAPCTARGKVTGAWMQAQARVLGGEEEGGARQALARKYFLMRFPWLWSHKNIFLEITLAGA